MLNASGVAGSFFFVLFSPDCQTSHTGISYDLDVGFPDGGLASQRFVWFEPGVVSASDNPLDHLALHQENVTGPLQFRNRMVLASSFDGDHAGVLFAVAGEAAWDLRLHIAFAPMDCNWTPAVRHGIGFVVETRTTPQASSVAPLPTQMVFDVPSAGWTHMQLGPAPAEWHGRTSDYLFANGFHVRDLALDGNASGQPPLYAGSFLNTPGTSTLTLFWAGGPPSIDVTFLHFPLDAGDVPAALATPGYCHLAPACRVFPQPA